MLTSTTVTMIVGTAFIIDKAGIREADAGGVIGRVRVLADIVVASDVVLNANVASSTTEGVCVVRSKRGSVQTVKSKNVCRCRGGEP